MTPLHWPVILICWLAAVAIVPAVAAWARRRNRLEVPNERSAHTDPTPGFGGLGIVLPVMVLLGWTVTNWTMADDRFANALLLGALVIAGVSLLDDLRPLPTLPRLAVHLSACAALVWSLLPELANGSAWLGFAVLSVVLAWCVNLTNFMDGIDGLVALFCVAFVSCLQLVAGGVDGYPGLLLWSLAAACVGFLTFNWSPASVFMGDVGSASVGFLLAGLSIAVVVDGQVVWLVPIVLSAGFWGDASWTLGVRLVTGQRIASAHRSHAYQILARRFGHARVSVGYALYVVLWCLPIAWVAQAGSHIALPAVAVAGAVLPVLLVCAATGAGRPTA